MSEKPFDVQTVEGRLLLARLSTFATAEAAQVYSDAIAAGVRSCTGNIVICADWSRAGVVPPTVAEVLKAMLERSNPRVERSALLVDPANAIFGLQAERIVREAAHPSRRTFREVTALLIWLGEVLTPTQLSAARAYLNRPR